MLDSPTTLFCELELAAADCRRRQLVCQWQNVAIFLQLIVGETAADDFQWRLRMRKCATAVSSDHCDGARVFRVAVAGKNRIVDANDWVHRSIVLRLVAFEVRAEKDRSSASTLAQIIGEAAVFYDAAKKCLRAEGAATAPSPVPDEFAVDEVQLDVARVLRATDVQTAT